MTQPPPYQGGNPAHEPPQQPGYGQPPQQPGYGQPPQQSGYGQAPQQPGQPASGFPPPGAPGTPGGPGAPPPQGGFGNAAKSTGKSLVIRLVIAGVVLAVLAGGGWLISVLTGDTSVAAVGDCTNQSADTTREDASDVKTVDCDSEEAYFKIVAREDSPSSNDHEAVAEEVCAGTDAAEYIYSERGSEVEWIICLDPIDIDTPKWGELPQAGECISVDSEYMELFDCGDPSATDEVVTAADGLSGLISTQTDLDNAAMQACGETGWEYYYSNLMDFGEELEWILCTKTPGT